MNTKISLLSLKDFGISKKEEKPKEIKVEKCIDTNIYETDTSIYGNYKDDLNLIELNLIIINKLKYIEENKIKEINDIINKQKEEIKKSQSKLERGYSIRLINAKEKELQDLISGISIIKYKEESKNVIEEYKKLGFIEKRKVLTAGSISNNFEENNKNKELRFDLIDEFINCANKYIKVNMTRIYNDIPEGNIICNNCFNITDVSSFNNESLIICQQCYNEIPKLTRVHEDSQPKDNKYKTGDYQDIKNYEMAIDKFMGLSHNNKLDIIDITTILDDYFNNIGLLIGSDIKDNYSEYSKVYNRALMKQALKTKGLNEFYSDLNYIMYLYWDKPNNDISHIKEQLLYDYQLSQPLYMKYKNPYKTSSMNVQYRLWRGLQRIGYHCEKSEFNIPQASYDYYDNIWKKICNDLNWVIY
jgi:hypothetical protein